MKPGDPLDPKKKGDGEALYKVVNEWVVKEIERPGCSPVETASLIPVMRALTEYRADRKKTAAFRTIERSVFRWFERLRKRSL